MRFADNEFNFYAAKTKADLAVELYKSSFVSVRAASVDDWCEQCAARIYEQYDYKFIFDDLETFVNELINYGFIKEIQ